MTISCDPFPSSPSLVFLSFQLVSDICPVLSGKIKPLLSNLQKIQICLFGACLQFTLTVLKVYGRVPFKLSEILHLINCLIYRFYWRKLNARHSIDKIIINPTWWAVCPPFWISPPEKPWGRGRRQILAPANQKSHSKLNVTSTQPRNKERGYYPAARRYEIHFLQ